MILIMKLYNAIIRQAVEDLFDKNTKIKQDAIDWIMDDEPVHADNSKVTFLDCCDFTGRSPYPLRKLMTYVIAGEANKTKTLEYFNG